MKQILLSVALLISTLFTNAQNAYRLIVQDKATHELLNGVSIISKGGATHKNAITDANGFAVLHNVDSTVSHIELSITGYATLLYPVIITDTLIHTIFMESDARTLADVVVVSSTRNNDRIENATTKVEVLGLADMNEESTLKPGNIASILGDVSGVQIQQSSATSGNANIRIQGLEGRYTQVLKDGMPLYGGYSGGFGVLSIPPLDLKQIELIKGSSSTLYGGGAIGGLVNIISKKPSFAPDASILINQTTLKETNINAYYAKRWKKIGFTFFAGETFQKEVDVNNDGFSDVPNTKSTLIHPTVFIYPSAKSFLSLGWSGSFEKRSGGDMIAIAGKQDAAHPYFENNKLDRNAFSLLGESKINNKLTLSVKGNVSLFKRAEITNTYLFDGRQNNYYGELSFVKKMHKHIIVGGVNIIGDKFIPSAVTPVMVGEFSNNTAGIYMQDTWQLLPNTKLETGLRLDYHHQYGNFLLPRFAIFHRLNEHWATRLGFGMGYITPNALTPQIRDYSIYQLKPIAANVTAERSYAGNAEINYKTSLGNESSFFINGAYFITQIDKPIVGTEDIIGNVSFLNQAKPVITQGFDTYVQIEIQDWEFYLGYTYTDAVRKYLTKDQFMPVTPRNRAAATIVFEKDQWRFGVEGSYNGYQYREDHTKTPGYLFMAAMIEKKFGEKWSLVLNCENLLDERQSKYESLYTGTAMNPSFKTLWAPIDGRVANLCLRFQPFAKRH